jgi:hypothetical protein
MTRSALKVGPCEQISAPEKSVILKQGILVEIALDIAVKGFRIRMTLMHMRAVGAKVNVADVRCLRY